MARHVNPFSLLLAAGIVGALLAGSCGSSSDTGSNNGGKGGTAATDSGQGGTSASGGQGGTGAAGSGGTAATDGGGGVTSNYPCDGCPSFPPIGTPECSPTTLGPTKVAYPPNGVLLPPNMNVLEVQFVPPTGATLFEVDFTNSITTVTVETKCNAITPVRGGASSGCAVTLPQGAWNDIANTNRDGDPVHVTVRSTTDGKCVSTSTDTIDLYFAKEDLAGGIYYWQSATYGGIGGKTGGIYSHDFGTFDPTPTPFMTSGASGTCIGCHTLARDGVRMAVMNDDPDADDEMGDVKTHIADVATRTLLGGKPSPGFQTFTHDHKRMIASTFKNHKNASWDVYDGDSSNFLSNVPLPTGMAATQPDMSKDDKTLIFVVPQAGSISTAGDHHFMGGALYQASWDPTTDTMGAPSAFLTPTGTVNYYYPTLSPDQSFVMFNEAADGDGFWNRKARVKLLHFPPAAGATPIDLPKLNADATIGNSWPRWSPFVQSYKSHKILWVTFSSNRDYGLRLANKGFDNCYPPESPAYDQPQPLSKQGVGYETCAQPQIWMAAILIDSDPSLDSDRSFPAFWLPFQDVNAHNFSAQWVEQVQKIPTPDGGTSDSGTDGGSCGDQGAACGTTGTACCATTICCAGSCEDFSNCIK